MYICKDGTWDQRTYHRRFTLKKSSTMKRIAFCVSILFCLGILSCSNDEVSSSSIEGTSWTLVKIDYLFNGETAYSTIDIKEARVSHKLSFENGNLTYDNYYNEEYSVAPYSIVENVMLGYFSLTEWGEYGKYKVVKRSNKEFVIETFVHTVENHNIDAPSIITYKGVPIQKDDEEFYRTILFYNDSYYYESKGYGGIEVSQLPSGDFYDTGRLYF